MYKSRACITCTNHPFFSKKKNKKKQKKKNIYFLLRHITLENNIYNKKKNADRI